MTQDLSTRALPAVALAAMLLAVPPLAAAQTELTGQTASGAYYRVAVPDGWTPSDGLVIWSHGYDLSPVTPNPDLGPLAALQLAEGYAVAASSYSLPGWAVFRTTDDLRQMVEAFAARYGEPDEVLLYGASLGGLVTVRAVEEGGLGNVTGALTVCGAVGGSQIWSTALDLRLLYDHVCAEVPEAAIPGGAQGLPSPFDPSFGPDDLVSAVSACTGIFLPADLRPRDQADRLATLLDVTGIPEEFLLTDMGFAVFGLADLIHDPRKLGGGQGVGNAGVDYGRRAINAGIARAEADPAALRRFLDNYTPTGQVGATKIVSIHTDKDGLVAVENQGEYARAVTPGSFTSGVVVEDVPTHCGFTAAETVAAWESLRGWVAGLPRPDAGDLRQTCDALVAGGLADGPCRIDPDVAADDLGSRLRPRVACDDRRSRTLCLADGRFQAEVEWTDFQDRTGPGRKLGYQTTDAGFFWFFSPESPELSIKVLDGRRQNGHFWVFYGSLTNVGFDLTVTDTRTGLVGTYHNSRGTFASVGDTDAF